MRPPSSLDSGQAADYLIDRTRHSVYIDDLNIYGIDRNAMLAAQQQYCTVMTAAGLPPKPSKVVAPTSSGLECLGVLLMVTLVKLVCLYQVAQVAPRYLILIALWYSNR